MSEELIFAWNQYIDLLPSRFIWDKSLNPTLIGYFNHTINRSRALVELKNAIGINTQNETPYSDYILDDNEAKASFGMLSNGEKY